MENKLKLWATEARKQRPYSSPLFPPSVYYRFFEIMNREMKFKNSVVLGVCGGGDCLHLALGNPEGKVMGIDSQFDHPEQIAYIEQHCPNFVFHLGDSVSLASLICELYGPIDFLFIDTIHTYSRTMEELVTWLPYMSKNWLICFDDLFRDEMKGLWEDLPEPKLRLDELHDGAEKGGGFGILYNYLEDGKVVV